MRAYVRELIIDSDKENDSTGEGELMEVEAVEEEEKVGAIIPLAIVASALTVPTTSTSTATSPSTSSTAAVTANNNSDEGVEGVVGIANLPMYNIGDAVYVRPRENNQYIGGDGEVKQVYDIEGMNKLNE